MARMSTGKSAYPKAPSMKAPPAMKEPKMSRSAKAPKDAAFKPLMGGAGAKAGKSPFGGKRGM